MLKYFAFLLLFAPSFLSAQNDVELLEEKTDKGITLKGVNNLSDQSVELIITINSVGFGLKKEEVFTKVVGPNSQEVIVEMIATPGRQCSYSANMTYNTTRKPSKTTGQVVEKVTTKTTKTTSPKPQQKVAKASKKKANPLDGKKGIVVYSKDGCGRCDYVTKYLKENNIPFEYLNISTDKAADDQMVDVLFANGFKGGSFTTPVITVDDKVHYNIKDLRGFLADLK